VTGKFQIFYDKAGEYRFRLRDQEDHIILVSESYRQKASAVKAIESIRVNATEDKHFERKTASNGLFMFNLKAANGQVIGSSSLYKSETVREEVLEKVRVLAPMASVDDCAMLSS
jgi:uncharacterized protein YegP (UPF0339 family)